MSTALMPCYTVTISGPDPLQKKKQQLSFHQVHLRAYICEINDACAGIRVVQFCTHNAQCRDTLSLMAARNKQHAGNVSSRRIRMHVNHCGAVHNSVAAGDSWCIS